MFIYMYYFISQLESDQSAKRATSANQSSQWKESSQGEIYPSTSSAAVQNKRKRSVSGRVFHRSSRVHEESTAARETRAATAEKGCLSSKVFWLIVLVFLIPCNSAASNHKLVTVSKDLIKIFRKPESLKKYYFCCSIITLLSNGPKHLLNNFQDVASYIHGAKYKLSWFWHPQFQFWFQWQISKNFDSELNLISSIMLFQFWFQQTRLWFQFWFRKSDSDSRTIYNFGTNESLFRIDVFDIYVTKTFDALQTLIIWIVWKAWATLFLAFKRVTILRFYTMQMYMKHLQPCTKCSHSSQTLLLHVYSVSVLLRFNLSPKQWGFISAEVWWEPLEGSVS